MTTLDAIANLAAAIKADDTSTTSRMLAFLETKLTLEEVFDLLDALAPEKQPAAPKPADVALCA